MRGKIDSIQDKELLKSAIYRVWKQNIESFFKRFYSLIIPPPKKKENAMNQNFHD